jgi:hypothetical protein
MRSSQPYCRRRGTGRRGTFVVGEGNEQNGDRPAGEPDPRVADRVVQHIEDHPEKDEHGWCHDGKQGSNPGPTLGGRGCIQRGKPH